MRRASIISSTLLVRLCLIAAAGAASAVAIGRFWQRGKSFRRASLATGDGSPPARQAAVVPLTPEQIAAAASARGLRIPAACEQGVAANLVLLAAHAERLRAPPELPSPPGAS